MHLSDIISPAAIAVRIHIEDKDHALRFAAASLGARSGLDAGSIRAALAAREALGSTGIGSGIAVPHACFSGLGRSYALFCTLAAPVDFDAIDGKPVDLVFTTIGPAGFGTGGGETLPYLAAVSRMLRNKGLASAVRNANNPWSVYDTIVEFDTAAQPGSSEAWRKPMR